MVIEIRPHAMERMKERGTNENEIIKTIETGEKFPAKFGRIGFRCNFFFNNVWRGRDYNIKQVEVFTIEEEGKIVVITVVVKYF